VHPTPRANLILRASDSGLLGIPHGSCSKGEARYRSRLTIPVDARKNPLKMPLRQLNVHKKHGYELEHNYGHGQQTLSTVFYLLNLLAFSTHVLLERGDRLYHRCLATTSRRELWHTPRTAMRMILVTA